MMVIAVEKKGLCLSDGLSIEEIVETPLTTPPGRVREVAEYLYDMYHSRLFEWILRLNRGDAELAEDVVQETFLKAQKSLVGFRAECEYYTWLSAIAKNTLLSYVRKAERVHSFFSEPDYFKGPAKANSKSIEDYEDVLLGNSPLVLDELLDGEMSGVVKGAIISLPEIFRKPVLMQYYLGLEYDEITEELQIPLGTVKSRLNRARKALAKNEALAEYLSS